METAKAIAKAVTVSITVGDPNADVFMRPVVSDRQWNRIQSLIKNGVEEGAALVTGRTGRPDGLTTGYNVKPTVFA